MAEGKEFIKDVKEQKGLKVQDRLSPTSINTYYRCPRQYFYTYIAKIKPKPNIHLVKGLIVHKTLEDFYRGYKDDLEKTMDKLFEKAWNSHEQQLKDLELPEEEIEQAKADCEAIVNEYLIAVKRKIANLMLVGKAENEAHGYYLLKPKFREKWLENKDLHLGGFIDRIHEDFDGLLTIGDYKTSSKFGIGLPEEYKRQLSLYSLLYYTIEKKMPHFAAVIFLRYGEEFLLEVTPHLLQYARDSLKYVYDRTRSTDIENYPLYEGSLCRWCPFNKICSGEDDWESFLRQARIQKLLEEKDETKDKKKS